MSHYAKINADGIVENVVVAEADVIEALIQETGERWVQTSYNTQGGVHYVANSNPREPSSDQSKALRKNYACIGFTYDEQRDAFIPPKPFASWSLNEQSCMWEAPIPYPGSPEVFYVWNEDAGEWVRDTTLGN